MKKYILLLIVPFLFFNSCEEDDIDSNNNESGYSCSSLSGCYVDTESPSYLTLSDCQNNCEEPYSIGELCFEIEINSSVNAEYQFDLPNYLALMGIVYDRQDFYLTGQNTSAVIEPMCLNIWNYYSSIPYQLEFIDLNSSNGCAGVEIRAYLNGDLINTENLSMGCISGASTYLGDTNCNIFCGLYGNFFEGTITF